MRRAVISGCLAGSLLLTGSPAVAASGLPAPATAGDDLTPRQVRRLMKERAKPGLHHQRLAPLVGRFRFRAYYRLTLDDNPESAHGAAEAHWTLGERFLEYRIRGRRMTRSFEGRLVLGFDSYTDRYVGIWLDELDPGIASLEGPPSEDGRTFRFEVISNDPRFAGKLRRQAELVVEGDDRHLLRFTEIDPQTQQPVVMAEITFERRAER